MSYMQEYEKWLASPALNEQEHAELESIGTMRRKIRAVLWATGIRYRRSAWHHEGGPAPDEHPRHPLGHSGLPTSSALRARRPKAPGRGPVHGLPQPLYGFARAAAEVCARQRHPCAYLPRSLRPCAGAELRRAGIRLSGGHQYHRQPQSQKYNGYKVYWSGQAAAPSTLPPLPVSWNRSDIFAASAGWG